MLASPCHKETTHEIATTVTATETDHSPTCPRAIPVRIHHLFQLVIENKLWVPVESRNSSGHIAFLDSAVRTAQTSAPSKLTQ